jgi:HlyD family secretion protein
MPDDQIQLRSEDVQDILSHIPHWVIRWGTAVAFLAVLMMAGVSWIVKFPDIISGSIVITTRNPPVRMVARTEGRLILFCREGQAVRAGDYLGAIDNRATVGDVSDFRRQLDSFRVFLSRGDRSGAAAAPDNANRDYCAYLQGYLDDKYFNQIKYQISQIKSLQARISLTGEIRMKYEQQRDLAVQELDLARKSYARAHTLLQQGHSSEEQAAVSQTVLAQKKAALEKTEADLIDVNLRQTEYQRAILDVLSQMEQWEQQYVFKAPIDGTASLYKYWSDNQYVTSGDEVMTIVPGINQVVGKLYLPSTGSGKIRAGQRVKIRFDSYPPQEYGLVIGTIESISPVPRGGIYLADVILANGLTTTYGKTLEFKQEMQGRGDVITEDMRLLQRIFNSFRYLLQKMAA